MKTASNLLRVKRGVTNIYERLRRNPFIRELRCKISGFFLIKKNVIILIISIFVLAAVIFLVVYIIKTGYININHINIEGSEGYLLYVDKTTLEEKSEKYHGKNYFAVNIDQIRDEILSDSPYISKVTVTKSFPDTLDVVVRERQPMFVMSVNNSSCVVFDKDSVVVEITREGYTAQGCIDKAVQYSAYYVETLNSKTEYVVGEIIDKFVIDQLAEIKEVLERNAITINKFLTNDTYCEVTVSGGRMYIFNLSKDIQEEIARLQIILDDSKTTFIEYRILDLRYERPVIKN